MWCELSLHDGCVVDGRPASIKIMRAAEDVCRSGLLWDQFLQQRRASAAEANISRDGQSSVAVIINHVALAHSDTGNSDHNNSNHHHARIKHFLETHGKLDVPDLPYSDQDRESISSDGESGNDIRNAHQLRSHQGETDPIQSRERQAGGESVTVPNEHQRSEAPAAAEEQPSRAFVDATINVMASNQLMESKHDTHKILAGGFPRLFPLGKGLDKHTTGLTVPLLKHLVSHFTTVFASNSHFLFYVFNCRMRSLSNQAASVALKDRDGAPAFFERYIADPVFLQKARHAARDPGCTDAKEVFRIVNPFLQFM